MGENGLLLADLVELHVPGKGLQTWCGIITGCLLGIVVKALLRTHSPRQAPVELMEAEW